MPVEPITTVALPAGKPRLAISASSDVTPVDSAPADMRASGGSENSDSMRGNTSRPSSVMRNAWRPRSDPAPRNLRIWIARSERASYKRSSSSMMPSTIVCSAFIRCGLPLVSRNTVQPWKTALVCTSWMNFFRSRSVSAASAAATRPSSTSTPTWRARISRRSSATRPFKPSDSRSWNALRYDSLSGIARSSKKPSERMCCSMRACDSASSVMYTAEPPAATWP